MDNKRRKVKGIISIVIPALDEEKGIARTIEAIPTEELRELGYEVQVLVVDNGSHDGTGEVVRKVGAEVILEPEHGYGRAYKTGFSQSRGDIIATTDADFTYPVEDIPKFVQILDEENLDFITTNRFAKMDNNTMSLRNKLGNRVLNLTMRLLFGIDLADSQSGMWVFRRSILDKLVLRSDGMAFSEELKLEACYFAKYYWKEIPIRYKARIGKIKLRGWIDGFQNLLYLIKKRIVR